MRLIAIKALLFALLVIGPAADPVWAAGCYGDDHSTFQQCRQAAECGNYYGAYQLGRMYEAVRGVRQDYAESARWYRKAAEKGYAKAAP